MTPGELRELLAASSATPWRVGEQVKRTLYVGVGLVGESARGVLAGLLDEPADAALIVAAVNALPGLLDENDRLRAALKAADAVAAQLAVVEDFEGSGEMPLDEWRTLKERLNEYLEARLP